MPNTALDQQPPAPKETRRRRTDAHRLADMQAELARLQIKAEAKALAATEPAPEAVSPKPRRTRFQRGRPKVRRAVRSVDADDHLDAELRDLVDGFVAALRDVIRRELVEQARRRLSE
jgi:hypothetical protein